MDEDFLQDFHHAATYGATSANGVDRQACTSADTQTRTWFSQWMGQAGFNVRVDAIGNMFGLVEWTEGAPFVFIGSHLDSQPRGGRFDGAYGVIAAMHAAKRLDAMVRRDGLTPKFNLAVVNWFNEEGSRFPPSVMGSSVFAGIFDRAQMLEVTDADGVSVREALDQSGFLGSDEPPTPVSYAEIHIEQGPILEREGIDLGLVDSSWYTQKLDIEVLGEQSHTGATAMADRHDALVAASKIVVMVNEVTGDFTPEALVSSVGQLNVEPNSPIVVPRRVHLVADLRSGDPDIVGTARATLVEKIADLAQQSDLTINVKDFDVRPIRYFPEEGVELTGRIAADLGYTTRRMQTMAGHDSVSMNTMVPSAMVFIPSVDGVSHCEREFSTDESMLYGVDMFTRLAHELVEGALAV